MCDWGFIYVMRNHHMPGVVKIGKTSRAPGLRAKELSTTGVPGEMEVAYAIESDRLASDEAMIHQRMSVARIHGGEYFRCSIACAVEEVMKIKDIGMLEAKGDSLDYANGAKSCNGCAWCQGLGMDMEGF